MWENFAYLGGRRGKHSVQKVQKISVVFLKKEKLLNIFTQLKIFFADNGKFRISMYNEWKFRLIQ